VVEAKAAGKSAAHGRLACAARPAPARLAHSPIKAIPGRKALLGEELPFLSCRGAVIVGADNVRVGGQWTQPKAVLLASG
jgi:hypothetical protein